MQLWKNIKTEIKYEILGVLLLGFSILTGIGLFWEANNSSFLSGNALGTLGNFLIRLMNGLAGQGKYFLPILFVLMAIKLIRERKISSPNTGRWLGFAVALLSILGIIHIPYIIPEEYWLTIKQATFYGLGGGLLGSVTALIFYIIFGIVGSYIVFSTGLVISFLLITNIHLLDLLQKIYSISKNFVLRLIEELGDYLFQEEVEDNPPVKQIIKESHQNKNNLAENIEDKPPIVKIFDEKFDEKIEDEEKKEIENDSNDNGIKQEKNNSDDLKTDTPLSNNDDNFQLPQLSLLQRNLKIRNPRMSKDISEKVKLLEETLASFNITCKVTEVSCGPAITRYEIQPQAGTKVSKIVNLADDIALNLAASDVRIEAPIPGKAAVGIEVPNKEVAVVHFREVLETKEFQNSKAPLTVALGMDIAGQAVVADLAKMPHLLVAGATGSGKSVCMNALICSLLFRCKPDELKLMVIDPKMVELTNFNGIPHLITPVVTDAKKAATALRWMVNEMENRYELFAAAGVRDISRYNSVKSLENPDDPKPALPYIVVLIDELADLMMVAPADVEEAICRLAQMARAAGIHLVVATQRPSVDVITGLIKANIPSRIAFAVSSQTDSRTILDMAGAEKLLGRGDMLLYPVGASKPLRVQGVYVSDKEVENIVDFLRSQGQPVFEKEILETESNSPKEVNFEDDLLPEAVRILIESGQASISMLQRRLRIGYTRAARLIDILEEKGVVGGYEGSKPRSVLIGWDEYKKMFGEM